MIGKGGMFVLILLHLLMGGGESVKQYKFTKVSNGGRVFLTPNLITTTAANRGACAFKCLGKSNCVAFHWQPSGSISIVYDLKFLGGANGISFLGCYKIMCT